MGSEAACAVEAGMSQAESLGWQAAVWCPWWRALRYSGCGRAGPAQDCGVLMVLEKKLQRRWNCNRNPFSQGREETFCLSGYKFRHCSLVLL